MPAGAVPTSADILGASATINSGLNLTSTRTRFKVLWDHVYHLDFYGPRSREIRKYFKVNTKCTYKLISSTSSKLLFPASARLHKQMLPNKT